MMRREDMPAAGAAAPGVTPEEQALYDKMVNNGYQLIYGSRDQREAVMESLSGAGDPVAGLANTSAQIVGRLVESARRNGVQLSDDVVFAGGMELFDDLANLQREAGIAELDEKQAEAALYQGMDRYREIAKAGGWLDEKGAAEQIMELRRMEESGELERDMPELMQMANLGGDPMRKRDTERAIAAMPPDEQDELREVVNQANYPNASAQTKENVRRYLRDIELDDKALVPSVSFPEEAVEELRGLLPNKRGTR